MYVCVYSIIVTNGIRLPCIDKPFLNGKIYFIISKLSFEKLPQDYS